MQKQEYWDILRKDGCTEEEILADMVDYYYENKVKYEDYKKEVDAINKDIKAQMKLLGKTEIESKFGLIAKLSVQKRESFNEDLLLSKIQSLNVPGIIKTKEYVDMDELENAIYNGKLDATELSSCRVTKEVTTLKISERKVK